MNIQLDILIKILEYVGNYTNLLILDKKTHSIFKNTDLYKLYINDMKNYLLLVDDNIIKLKKKINHINKRLKLYNEPHTYQSCSYIEILIDINHNDKLIFNKCITNLENEKKILGYKISL